jgi:hypothetical protein
MKRAVLWAGLLALVLWGCASPPPSAKPTTAVKPATAEKLPLGADQILPYVHVDGFGTETDDAAWIAWEFEALDFVKYQVAFTSCTCRQESINERSLLFVEIAKGETGGKIRKVWFEYWGDSPAMPSGITKAEIESQFMPKLVNKKLSSLDSVDTVSGATVTSVNVKQILKAILAYHNAKYPAAGMPEPVDVVDAVSGPTVVK